MSASRLATRVKIISCLARKGGEYRAARLFGDYVSVLGTGQHVRDRALVDDQYAVAHVLSYEAQRRATVLHRNEVRTAL